MKKVRIIAVIKVFTIGFNGENGFFLHCKRFNVKICVKLGSNVYYYEDIKTKKNHFHRLKSEILPKTFLCSCIGSHLTYRH